MRDQSSTQGKISFSFLLFICPRTRCFLLFLLMFSFICVQQALSDNGEAINPTYDKWKSSVLPSTHNRHVSLTEAKNSMDCSFPLCLVMFKGDGITPEIRAANWSPIIEQFEAIMEVGAFLCLFERLVFCRILTFRRKTGHLC